MLKNIADIGAAKVAVKNIRSIRPIVSKTIKAVVPGVTEDNDPLKIEFQDALKAYAAHSLSLRQIVTRCLAQGVQHDELIEWALELPNWNEATIRSVLSFVLREHGIERNKKGQGRRTNAEAMADANKLVERFDDDFARAEKHALAVYRAVKKLAKASK